MDLTRIESSRQVFTTTEKYLHPNYSINLEHDIALIKLQNAAIIGSKIIVLWFTKVQTLINDSIY